MFLFLAFVVAGVVCLLVDAIATYVAIAGLVAIPAAVGYYLTDAAGVNDFMIRSFHYLSGVHNPYDLVHSVPGARVDGSTWIGIGVGLVLLLLGFIVGVAAILGIPLGLATTLVGSVKTVARRGSDWLADGVLYLFTGLAAAVLTGVIMRMVRYLNLWGHHQPLPPTSQLVGPSVIAGVTLLGWVLVVSLEERHPWLRPRRRQKADDRSAPVTPERLRSV